ncbi:MULTISPECIES: cell wall hydrolase [Mesorhizobium]|uniref:Cell wall hydrolase n=1 Tax=Mesorhizobium denitrificans TaxID=2294114 RepID=A0A371XIL7_9HYPH|nr:MULTISPECIES: cell wall hydrolase [Mesorhizobium]RFC68894.1 cell wall hydrolase [Mesorhizobium denitrificans]
MRLRVDSLLRLGACALKRRIPLKTPALVAVAVLLAFPTVGGRQDIAGLIAGDDSGTDSWGGYVQKAAAGSVHQAEMPFGDSGLLSGGGVKAPGLGKVAFRGHTKGTEKTPDEVRVNSTEKKGRIVGIERVAPPKAFNAGTVFERTSMLRPSLDTKEKLTFAKPAIKGKEVEIASAFHTREVEQNDPGIPRYLAELVNNHQSDILATAYASAAPDYAQSSPFESLLNEDPDGGRFIPPMGQGDHAWLQQPLPASVFSGDEQACLANAVYFEARGESLRGQAAVAQVVLNRVRNPAYPKTICGVVYQNRNWRNACQFSFACDGRKDVVTSPGVYRKAQDVALAVTAGKIFIPEVGSSTHYYAQYVSPGWARYMKKMTKIGLHIFYRTKNGGWS